MTPYLFTYIRILVIAAETISCEIMFSGMLTKRKMWAVYFVVCCLVISGISALLALINGQILVAFDDSMVGQAVASLLSVFVIILATVVAFRICFTDPLSRIAVCCVFGYCTRHIIFSVYTLIVKILGEEYVLLNYAPVSVIKFVLYFAICIPMFVLMWLCFARKVNKRMFDADKNSFLWFGIMLLMNVLIGECCEVYGDASLNLYVLCLICQIALCLLMLFIQVFLIEKIRIGYEKKLVEQLLQRKMEQYDAFKRNAELLNIKVHDLKYQLAAMKNGNASVDDIKETEELIRQYDTIVLTESQLLNTILTEKQVECYEKNIRFSCIADGTAASNVSPAEMYALLGNALDNAIEAAEKCSEISHRCVSLTMRKERGLALIEVDNYYETEPKVRDGVYESSKTDGGIHGYGIKSIKSIVKKYGGSVNIRTDSGIFTLSIIIPEEKTE